MRKTTVDPPAKAKATTKQLKKEGASIEDDEPPEPQSKVYDAVLTRDDRGRRAAAPRAQRAKIFGPCVHFL